MTLWFVFALMTAAAIFAVLWPLSRRPSALRSGSDVAVYRDQLDEVRRDRASGLIGANEAAAAEVEVSRRLLAAAAAEAAVAAPLPQAQTRHRRAAAVAAGLLLPAVAIALYLTVGAPSIPGQPLASRAPADRQSITQMVAQVEAHLAKNPNEGRGWEVVAPIYLRLGRYEDAVKARRLALKLSGETAERQAGLGEALTAAANGIVTAEALTAFKAALALDPAHVKARFFLGLAAEQDGRVNEAIAIWRALLDEAAADAPYAAFIRGELLRVAGAPSAPQDAGAGNLAPDERLATVKGMVARLAERLAKDGSDIEGWLRLVRSYMVLGERERALAAAGDARRALAAEPEKLRRIDDLVRGLGLEG
ncbi:MAG: c-type cytochrome biogenesis protein CcmI [Hyphomicrobiales bacterium]|nr:c-type cytochrome biogenesis protein CcmI [Hyphomicrobiales bacterium]